MGRKNYIQKRKPFNVHQKKVHGSLQAHRCFEHQKHPITKIFAEPQTGGGQRGDTRRMMFFPGPPAQLQDRWL